MRTQVQTGNASDANLYFFMPRGRGLTDGIRADILPDAIANQLLPSVVVGGISRAGKVTKGATVVPTLQTDAPLFNKQNKIIRASAIDQDIGGGKSRKVLVSHKEGADWIVLIRTGFQIGQQGMMGDYMDLLNAGTLKSHGSFNFDKKGGAYKLAEGREEQADFGKVAAEKIHSVQGRKITGVGSQVNYDMWRLPEGAVIITRDVNGMMHRLIGGKWGVVVADAAGYDRFFDALFAQDVEDRKKLVGAKKSA